MNLNLKDINDKQMYYICNRLKNNKTLNDKQIVYLFNVLKSNTNKNDISIFFMLLGFKKISLNDLYNEFLNINELNKIKNDIIKSDVFYKHTIDFNKFLINSNIDKITNNICLILSNSNYIYSLRILNDLYSDLEYFIDLYFKFNKSDKNNTNINEFDIGLHKFITKSNIFKVLDLIHSTNNVITNHTDFKNIKDYYINNSDLICFKIDYELLKSNQYLLNKIDYFKIVIYNYDSTDVYYICNEFDLINLDIGFGYYNYLSYLLDYSFDKYYNFFNDKKRINKGFEFIKTYNNSLSKLVKNIDKNNICYKYHYTNNNFYTFDNLKDIVFELDFKYIDLDLVKYLNQIDLELISIDNNFDYNSMLNIVYDKLNNLVYDLYNDLDNLKFLNSDLLLDLIDLSKYNDIDYKSTYNKYPITLLIDFINDYNYNTMILNNLDKNDITINNIKNDITNLNKVLDILNTMFKDLDKNNTLYEFKGNKVEFLKETLKHHNTKNKSNDLDRIRNGTLNYCYDVNLNYFKIV